MHILILIVWYSLEKVHGNWLHEIKEGLISVDFLKKAYYGLHDLELELAVKKVGEV